MRVWKLTPTNLADLIWKLWSPEPWGSEGRRAA